MAARLTYIQNHDGNRKWIVDRFTDDAHASEQYVCLCQHSDGNVIELDIIKIPRSQWDVLVKNVNEALEGFK